MKANRSGYCLKRSACCLVLLMLLGAAAAFHGCSGVSEEKLARAVETAMKETIYRHKAEAIENLTAKMKWLATRQLQILNEAEKVYDTQTRFEPIPYNVYGLGFMYKVKRNFSSYEIVDMAESDSLLYAYAVYVAYNYEILQTETQPTAFDGAEKRAEEDFNFEDTGKRGTVEFAYQFDSSFECVDPAGEFLGVSGDLFENYSTVQPPVTRKSRVIQAVRRGAMQRR
jgi:hypothetical protein